MQPQSPRPTAPLDASAKPTKKCKFCDREFTPKVSWQKFCTSKHKTAYWNIQAILNPKEESNDD